MAVCWGSSWRCHDDGHRPGRRFSTSRNKALVSEDKAMRVSHEKCYDQASAPHAAELRYNSRSPTRLILRTKVLGIFGIGRSLGHLIRDTDLVLQKQICS